MMVPTTSKQSAIIDPCFFEQQTSKDVSVTNYEPQVMLLIDSMYFRMSNSNSAVPANLLCMPIAMGPGHKSLYVVHSMVIPSAVLANLCRVCNL